MGEVFRIEKNWEMEGPIYPARTALYRKRNGGLFRKRFKKKKEGSGTALPRRPVCLMLQSHAEKQDQEAIAANE